MYHSSWHGSESYVNVCCTRSSLTITSSLVTMLLLDSTRTWWLLVSLIPLRFVALWLSYPSAWILVSWSCNFSHQCLFPAIGLHIVSFATTYLVSSSAFAYRTREIDNLVSFNSTILWCNLTWNWKRTLGTGKGKAAAIADKTENSSRCTLLWLLVYYLSFPNLPFRGTRLDWFDISFSWNKSSTLWWTVCRWLDAAWSMPRRWPRPSWHQMLWLSRSRSRSPRP